MEFFKAAKRMAAGALTLGAAAAVEPDFSTYTLKTPTAEARRLNPEVAKDIGDAITHAMQDDPFMNAEVKKVLAGGYATVGITKITLDDIVGRMVRDRQLDPEDAVQYCRNVTHALAIIDKTKRGALTFTVKYFEGDKPKGTSVLNLTER